MSAQVQELIDKIKSEGVQEGNKKAEEIEQAARQKADKIVAEAKAEADKLVTSSKEEIKKLQESTQMALKQSARDTVLSLRKEIESMLDRIVQAEVSGALSQEQLASILTAVINATVKDNNKAELTVSVSEKDLKALTSGMLSKLKDSTKKSVTLQSSEDVTKGFTISFDEGKSCYEFTDTSLAEFLSNYLNEQTGALLKEAVK